MSRERGSKLSLRPIRIRRFTIATVCGATLAALALAAAPAPPKNLARALVAQQELVAASPNDAGALNDLGNLLVLAGDRQAAEAAFVRSLELAPDKSATHFNLGLLLARTGRRAAALRQFRAVLDLDPGNAWAHYQVGRLYDSWGMDRLARRAYTRAFRLDPSLANARVNPDVVGNRQATLAMLEAWSDGIHETSAPSQYTDAGRIAGLLIDYPAPPAPSSTSDDQLAGSGWGDDEVGSGGYARLAQPAPSTRGDSRRGDSTPMSPVDEERAYAEKLAANADSGGDSGASESRVLTPDDLGGGAVNQVGPAGGRTTNQRVTPASPRSRTRSTRGGTFPQSGESTGRLDLRLVAPPDGPATGAMATALAG